MKPRKQRTKGRYQLKREAGLVPYHYDHESRSFMEGAWKHWPNRRDYETKRITWTLPPEDRATNNDAKFLELAREAR